MTQKIIGAAIDVHRTLGPGLLESAYKECLVYKLKQENFVVIKEKAMPLVFEEVKLECGYRIDILVENRAIIEIKSVESLNDVHLGQTLTYMKLGDFNVTLLNQGIIRLINGSL